MNRWLQIPAAGSWKHDPAVLREFLLEQSLSGAEAGALIGVDGRTIRKWTGGERAMPYSAWYALIHIASK